MDIAENLLFACFISLILFFYTCSSTANEILKQNCASSCGKIHNISYPFRLKSDPPGCGVDAYELSCEGNSTLVLYLKGAQFNVKAINYDNYTIRVVDQGVDNDDCSSLPRFTSSYYNISESFQYEINWTMTMVVEVLKCVEPVNSTTYLDASSCIQQLDTNSSLHYKYAYVGSMSGFDLRKGCNIEAITLIRPPDSSVLSYIEFHRRMAFGFELVFFCECSVINCYHVSSCIDINVTIGNSKSLTKRLKNYAEALGHRLFELRLYISFLFGSHFNIIQVDKEIRGDARFSLPSGLLHGAGLLAMYGAIKGLCGTPVVISFLIYKWRRRHLSGYQTIEEFLQRQSNLMPIRYSYSNIKKMTGGFSEMLGKGGFGSVYKGKLRSGQSAAIKILEKSKANGQDFMNEVATIGRIHHANIVRLIGFCSEGSKHALVYEFMANGSLDNHIFSSTRSISLSWEKLYDISLGIARGIEYLHRGCEMQILHFDIKPHNILLDESFAPKISDFGLAKFYSKGDTSATLTAARGTIGYMAPELVYKNIGRASYKADVYSFGMLLLEITGRRRNLHVPTDDPLNENLSQVYYPFLVYDKLLAGNLEIEDAIVEENEFVRKMIITGLWCIQMQPSSRPSMNEVVEMLEGDLESLQFPPRPLLFPIESMKKDEAESSSSFSVDSSNTQQKAY